MELLSYTLSFAVSAFILFQINPLLMVILPAFLLAVRWYWIGLLALIGVSVYSIVLSLSGARGFLVVASLLLNLELASMVGRRSGLRGHVYIWVAVVSSFFLYLLVVIISSSFPRLRVTVAAVLLMIVVYVFVRDVLS